jgi:hypothetical protein
LQIVASQVIYDCKKDKYILSYNTMLKLATLIGISWMFCGVELEELPQHPDVKVVRERHLAVKTREMVANRYTCFFDDTETWQKDYEIMVV